ncbi:glycoside hydrolase [Pendulispora brunnea]|uniref:Glycoside hydrolase n=1 Tax=Pendulispora brunnea TaxID=2905690 RepID=A0ABZ2KL27_9BACT
MDTPSTEGNLSSVEPGWPPTISAANPNWMQAGAGNPRRSMPATFVTSWVENGVAKKRQLLSFSNHADGTSVSMQLLWRDYGDNGGWHLARKRVGTTIDWTKGLHDTAPGNEGSFGNVYERQDANHTLVAISYRPVKVDGRWMLVRHESTDHGVSWELSYAPLTLPAGVPPGLIHQGITVTSVGGVETLLLPMYYRNADTYWRWNQALIKSTDGGQSWSYQGMIAQQTPWCPGFQSVPKAVVRPLIPADGSAPAGGNGFAEATVAETRSGKLLAVVRCDQWFLDTRLSPDQHVRSYLYKSISSDHGATWSAPARIAVPNSGSGPVSGLPVYGVSPKLVRMGGGALMLAFGRPGNILAFDSTGEGDHWETFKGWPDSKRWDNAPTPPAGDDGIAPEGRLWIHHGSSGYMGIAKLSEQQFMVVGDNCQADWGCGYTPPAGSSYPHGTDYFLWNLLVSYIPK